MCDHRKDRKRMMVPICPNRTLTTGLFSCIVSIILMALLIVDVPIPCVADNQQSPQVRNLSAIDTTLSEAVDLQRRGQVLCSTFVDAKVDTAISLFERAIARRRSLGMPDDTAVASLHWWIAFAHITCLRMDSSRIWAKRALTIWESLLGPDHPENARALWLLGFTARPQQVSEAELAYQRAVSLLDTIPEYDPQTLGLALTFWSWHFTNIGRYSDAERMLNRAIELFESSGGPVNWLSALAHEFMATVLARSRAESERVFREARVAVDLYERSLGRNHPMTAGGYEILGGVYRENGLPDSAEIYYRKNIEICRSVGRAPDAIMVSYRGLAWIAHGRGQWDRAVAFMDTAVALQDRCLTGALYPDRALFRRELARFQYAAGHIDQAVSTLIAARTERHNFLQAVVPRRSDDVRLAIINNNPFFESEFATLALETRRDEIVRESFIGSIMSKGILIDALVLEREVEYCADDSSLSNLFNTHAMLCEEIANIYTAGLIGFSRGEEEDSIAVLYALQDTLEQKIGAVCAEYADSLIARQITISELARSLPEKAVFVDFQKYWPYRPRGVKEESGNFWGAPHYLAYLVKGDGSCFVTELGLSARVDSLIMSVSENMANGLSQIYDLGESEAMAELTPALELLYNELIAPLEPHLDDVHTIIACPTRDLFAIPLEILVLANGKYLTERYQISYVSSGRDIFRFASSATPGNKEAIVLHSPNYDGIALPEQRTTFTDLFANGKGVSRGPSAGEDCLSAPFDRLTATSVEGTSIADLLRTRGKMKVTVLENLEASEASLKQLRSAPYLLHIATHGYFCPQSRITGSHGRENPLLYSGLVLTGANRTIMGLTVDSANAGDGLLTALEASGLNLIGTELVILSACRTGSGITHGREGIFGLRRAFRHAGARSVIMSLFDVSDESTTQLMLRFYTGWLNGTTKVAALRQAALSIIAERRNEYGVAHPLYWGGFVLVGDPN
jgi:CHAT domain-containing protein